MSKTNPCSFLLIRSLTIVFEYMYKIKHVNKIQKKILPCHMFSESVNTEGKGLIFQVVLLLKKLN